MYGVQFEILINVLLEFRSGSAPRSGSAWSTAPDGRFYLVGRGGRQGSPALGAARSERSHQQTAGAAQLGQRGSLLSGNN